MKKTSTPSVDATYARSGALAKGMKRKTGVKA